MGAKETDCPEQIMIEGEGAIITLGVIEGPMVMVVLGEEAVVGTAQLELDDIIQ